MQLFLYGKHRTYTQDHTHAENLTIQNVTMKNTKTTFKYTLKFYTKTRYLKIIKNTLTARLYIVSKNDLYMYL